MVGLVEIVLSTLCMDITLMREYQCPGDEVYPQSMDISTYRKYRYAQKALLLAKQNFTIATVENMPLSGSLTNSSGTFIVGTAFDFLEMIQEKYKFNYNVVIPKDKTMDVDKNGVIGMLSKEEIDIGVAFLPVMTTFKNYLDYSRALDEGEWVALMKRPHESATGSGLWAPFTLNVWLLILLSLIVVGPVIYSIIALEVKLRKDPEFPMYPLPACVWFVYGALLKQGSTLSPITDSSRMLFATWWIFITILTAFYTANLTAFLTLSKFTLPIAKPEDIGKKNFRWVGTEGNAVDQAMKVPNSSLSVVSTGTTYRIVDSPTAVILSDWVKNNYMYLNEKPNVEYLMYEEYKSTANQTISEDKRCSYVITPFTVVTYSRAFAFRRGFEFNELFDHVIQHLFESGIVKYRQRRDLPNTEICPMNLGSKERQLRNADLMMTYALVGGGFCVAAAVFIFENLLRFAGIAKPQSTNAPHLNNFFAEKSILRSNKRDGKFKFATFTDNNVNVKGTLWHEMNPGSPNAPPPPPYHALFQPPFPNSPNGAQKNINGRNYWVVKSVYGETKLIPVRTPSALLFQYNKN